MRKLSKKLRDKAVCFGCGWTGSVDELSEYGACPICEYESGALRLMHIAAASKAVLTLPVVYSPDCYICNDPEYAQMGLPLCRECPRCSGHIPADDETCDNCGLNKREFYELQREEQRHDRA